MTKYSVRAALMGQAALLLVASATGAVAQSDETITVGLSSEVTSMDPHFHNLTPNNQIGAHIFDSLINQDENQGLIPGLATEWGPIDDLTWEFKLREGVSFHDGSPFTADDVVCTFVRAPDVPNSPSSFGTYTKGKTVEKIDDFTVHIKTENPYPLMANDVSTIMIISDEKGCGATTEDFNTGAATFGTGPWKFVSYTPGEGIVMARAENHWGEPAPFAGVTFAPIKSDPARVAALLAGDVDMINNVPTTDLATIKANEDLTVFEGVSNRVIYLHMDQFREDSPHVTGLDGEPIKNPLLDVRVRKAISHAISRELIKDRVMEGQSIVAGQLLPEGFFGVSPNLEPDPYDTDLAKSLLEEAGYGEGFKITIHGPNDRYVNDAKIVEAIAQMLTRVGIEASVETMPRSVYFKRASAGGEGGLPEFSLILVGWGAGSGEASSPLRSLIATHDKDKGMGASNRGRHSDPEVDAMIMEALQTVDDAARQDLLAKATEKAIGENYAIIPIHYQVNAWAARKGIEYTPRTDEYTLMQSASPSN